MDLEAPHGFEPDIENYIDSLYSERGASDHTLSSYQNDLSLAANLFVEWGLASWDELQQDHLFKFQSTLGPPLAAATQLRRLSSLRGLIKFIKKEGRLKHLRLPSGLNVRKPKRLPKALSSESMEAILNVPNLGEPIGLRDRALMELIYGAGLRISEAVGLRIDELQLDTASIRVTGKRGKTRWLPLPATTIPWIEKWINEGRPRLEKRPKSFLLLGARGGALTRQHAYARLTEIAKEAGVESHVSPHILRHTYAVHLLKGGADLRSLQELLGHESITTTQVYTQLDTEELKKKYRNSHPRD